MRHQLFERYTANEGIGCYRVIVVVIVLHEFVYDPEMKGPPTTKNFSIEISLILN